MGQQYSTAFKARVVQDLLRENKTIAQIAAETGVHPNQLGKWKALAVAGLPSLFDRRDATEDLKARHEQETSGLYAEIGRLTTQLAWLKKNVASSISRGERLALVERAREELPVTVQADLLSLSRSSLYYRPVGPSPEEVALKHRIDTIDTQYPFFGSRRIAALLRRDGVVLNRKAVQRPRREMGIAGIHPGPNTSKRRLEHRVYPYLLRNVTSAYPNHVWGIDITYMRLQRGWMYLVAVLDWYARYVVSWALDQTLELPFVLAAVEHALGQAAPAIWNSDQGSHFTSPQYLALLAAADVQVSIDGKGRALDNIFTERLWRTVKYEEVYLQDDATPKDARQGLTRYLDFYNHTRPHQALGYRTPADIYGAAPA